MSRPTSILAIDPGAEGGFAYWHARGGVKAERLVCPKTTGGLSTPFRNCLCASLIVMESQQGTGRLSDFAFGVHYGRLIEAIDNCALPGVLRTVGPQIWQRAYAPLPKERGPRKRELKQKAKEFFPEIRVTMATADALLILRWAMEKEGVDYGC